MIYTIQKFKLGNENWYSFQNLPQEKSYFKIGSLHISTNEKAIKTAIKILQANGYESNKSQFIIKNI